MATEVADASALLDAIEAQLGTREVAIQIINSRWLARNQITDSNLSGVTTATIIAYSGKGMYSAEYTFGAVVPVTLDAPVLAQTSAAGASPFTMDVTYDTDTVQDGDFLHYQIATDSGFTAITQEDTFILQPADIAGGETSDWGYLTPSGTFYIRARVERDDGASTITSDWSNTEGDTITAASTQLHTTNGVNKNQYATITGTPPLTLTGTNGVNAAQASRATNAIPVAAAGVKRVFECTPGAITGNLAFGIENGVTDMSGFTHAADSNNGACIQIGAGTLDTYLNSNSSFTNVGAHVAGDTYSVVHEQNTGICTFYRTRGGTSSLLGTRTFPAPLATPYAYVAAWQSDAATMNFGQSAFARTLGTGEIIYG